MTSQEKYISMLRSRSRNPVAWDALVTNSCTIKDLDSKRIRQIAQIAVDEKRLPKEALSSGVEDILKKFGLIFENRLVNAAVVLFCKNERKQFMQSNLKLARFKGTTKSEFQDEKSFCGNIFELYDNAMIFLDNYLPVAARIEEGNPFRVTTPAIPQKVLREAVVNALCHKDYSIESGSITIAIYDDRIEITSSGKLPSAIKLKDLARDHESFPRNRLIAKVLYACHMIEQWGRGTQEMIELCQKSGNPIPRFEETTSSLWVTLPLREPIPRVELTRIPTVQLADRQKEILEILEHGPSTRKQIMSKMKNPPSDRTVQSDLLLLNKLGLITAEGKARALTWISAQK